jgi:cholesterol transport system auxiliary component
LHGDAILSKRAFLIQQPASSPDAKGGVVATRAAAEALAGEMAQWLGNVARERPQAVASCKGA